MIDPITQIILEQKVESLLFKEFRKAFPSLNKKVGVVFHGTSKHKKIKIWWKTKGVAICNKYSKTPEEKKGCLNKVKSQL